MFLKFCVDAVISYSYQCTAKYVGRPIATNSHGFSILSFSYIRISHPTVHLLLLN